MEAKEIDKNNTADDCSTGKCYEEPQKPAVNPVTAIKELREKIFPLLDIKKYMWGTFDPMREISLIVTKLEEARMWMGKLLGKLGEAYPYPESMNPESPVIEKATDIPKVDGDIYGEDNVVNLKLLRQNITETLSQFRVIAYNLNVDYAIQLIVISIEQRLIEANMWAGMALGSLRKEEESK